MEMKRILALVLAAVLCFGLLLTGCGKEKTLDKEPLRQLLDSVEKTSAMMERIGPDFSAVLGAMEKGRISVDAFGYLESVTYIDQAAGGFANYMKLGPEGQQWQLSLIKKDQELALMFPSLLGDRAYGSKLEDLKDVPVWGLMGIDPQSYGQGGGMLGALGALSKLRKDLVGALDGLQLNGKMDKARVAGEEVEAIVVSFQLDVAQLRAMLGLPETMELAAGVAVNIHPETEHIMSIDCRLRGTVNGNPGDIGLILTLGKDTAASGKYTLDIQSLDGSQVVAFMKVQLNVEDSDAKTTAYLTITGDGEGIEIQKYRAAFEHDKQTQRFTLDVDNEGQTSVMDGMLRYKEDIFQLYIATLRKDGEERVLDATVSFEAGVEGEFPQIPEYTHMSQLTEEQWKGLVMVLALVMGKYPTN